MDFSPEDTWVAVDTETTGLNPWEFELLEIGAVKFRFADGVTERFQVLVKPKKKQDPRSRAVHQISSEEIEEKGTDLKTALENFLSFIEDFPLVFHNAPFDLSFLTLALKKEKLPIFNNYYYDNVYISRKHFKERKAHGLSSLKAQLGISNTGKAHRALSDAETTALIFIHSLKQKLDNFSKTKVSKFLQYHRRVGEFEIKLPKNLSEIKRYFDAYIRRGSIVKLQYTDQRGKEKMGFIKPTDFLILNQKIFLKGTQMDGEEGLFPITNSVVHDPEKGKLKF